ARPSGSDCGPYSRGFAPYGLGYAPECYGPERLNSRSDSGRSRPAAEWGRAADCCWANREWAQQRGAVSQSLRPAQDLPAGTSLRSEKPQASSSPISQSIERSAYPLFPSLQTFIPGANFPRISAANKGRERFRGRIFGPVARTASTVSLPRT